MRHTILTSWFVIMIAFSYAQDGVPSRKILYLQTDKEVYQSDETIWFKAFICNVTGMGLDTTIQNVYVDIYDAARKLIAHQKYISYIAMAKGQFSIPKGSKDERYWLVAYRRNDVLRDPENYYVKMVRVYRGKGLAASPFQSPRTEPMPASKLFLKPDGQDLIVSLHNDDKAHDSVILRLSQNGRPYFEQGYTTGGKTRLLIRYPMAELIDGINNVALLSPDGSTIEERTILIHDPSRFLKPVVRFDTLDLAANGANAWHVSGLGDANLSVSVTDAELPVTPYGLTYQVTARSILQGRSRLLAEATQDPTSIIHDLTGGLVQAPPPSKMDTTPMPLDRLLTLQGRVTKIDPRKGKSFFPSKADIEFYHDKKQSGHIKSFIINDSLLRERELFYFDTTYVRGYMIREGEMEPNYKVSFDTLYRPMVPSPALTDEDEDPATPSLLTSLEDFRKGGQTWDSTAKALTLSTVVVRASYHDKVRMADQLYTANYFTARDAYSILLDDDSSFRNSGIEIGQYIASRAPGLLFRPIQDAEYIANQYNTPSTYFQVAWAQQPGVMLYLNENPVPYERIQELPHEDFSYVKVMRGNWNGPYTYAGPAIAFYTRKGTNQRWDAVRKDLIRLNNGYTQAENFDDLQQASKFSQWSSTLYWNPDVYSRKEDGGLTIRFRNNTVTHRFRIVIEGLTHEGRPMHFERVVERK